MSVSHLPTALSERWFRTRPDSSVLERPRLLARLLIDVADLDDRIGFYERLLGVPADLRMPIPDFGGLELAAIGNLLLIASARPFTPIQRQTRYSLIVPSLTGQLERLHDLGGRVLEPPEVIVPGSRARVRYPDGSLAELVEHRPRPGEQPKPAAPAAGLPTATGPRLLARRAVPRAAFDAALAFYRSALEITGADSPTAVCEAVELAVVGNLLLIGSEEPEPADADRPAFALLTSPGDGSEAHVGQGGGPRTVVLPGGTAAEVWDAKLIGI